MIDIALIFESEDYDNLWNLRNQIQPFVKGDKHFDGGPD